MNDRKNRRASASQLICLQQLQKEGVPVAIPEYLEPLPPALDIRTAGRLENLVFESPSGQPYYAVSVCLIAGRPVTVTDVRLTVPWDDEIAYGDVPERGPLCYHGSESYPRNEVLNSKIVEFLTFHRQGQTVTGWFLACGLNRIPAEYRTHSVVPAQLTFTDSLGEEYGETIELSVRRTARQLPPRLRRALFAPQALGGLTPSTRSRSQSGAARSRKSGSDGKAGRRTPPPVRAQREGQGRK